MDVKLKGVSIVDNTKPLSAKAQFAPRPNVNTLSKVDREKHFDKELEKYIFGTNANGTKVMSQSDELGSGLTGFHYFVLNSGIMYTDPKGKPTNPRWRMDDEDLIFNPLELCDRKIARNNGDYDDFVIIKRRRFGLSTTFFGAYTLYNLIVNPGSVYGITSADWRRIGDGFTHKLNPMWLNYESDLKPMGKSAKGVLVSQSGAKLEVEYKDRNEDGEYRMGYAQGIETAKNPKNMEGFTLFRAFLDEIALHPLPKKVRASCNAALSEDLFRIGYMIMGGTVGEMTVEGAKELKSLIDSRVEIDEYGKEIIVGTPHIVYSLVMGCHAVKQFTTNGFTDHKAATEWIQRERENLNKNPDKTDLEKFITDYPLTKEEMFDVTSQCSLPIQLKEPWRIQLSMALSSPEIGEMGYFERDFDTNLVKWVKHKDGNIWIREPYNAMHTYAFGTDPIPFESDDDEEGSENSMIGEDLTTEKICFIYNERSSDPDMIVRNCIMAQDYFGGGKNMIEKNRGGVLMRTYKLMGREDLMAKKPKIGENQKWGDIRDKYGWHKASNSEYAYSLQINSWNKKLHQIDVTRYLEDMRFWRGKKKPDLIDASVSLEILKEDMRERQKKDDYEQPEYTRVRTIQGGKYVFIDIPLKGGTQ